MHFAGYYTKVDLATDALAERSKAVAQGAIPKGRGFEPHRRHFANFVRLVAFTSEYARASADTRLHEDTSGHMGFDL